LFLLEVLRACWDDIRIDKLGALVKVSGTAWGVMIVVTLFSIGSGLAKLNLEAVEKSGGLSGVEVTGNLTAQRIAQLVSYASEEFRVAPHVEISGSFLDNASVVGTSPSYLRVMELDMGQGRFLSEFDIERSRKVCCLGQGVAVLLFGESDPLGKEVWFHDVRYEVVGVMARETAYEEAEKAHGLFFVKHIAERRNRTIYIPYTTAMRCHGATLNTVKLHFRPESITALPQAIERIEEIVMEVDASEGQIQVAWRFEKELEDAKHMIGKASMALSAILGVCLFMSGVGVANLMYSQVSKQTKEIGIKKAVGANNRSILLFYLFEAIFLSATGGGLGIILGVLVAWVGNTIVRLPFSISWVVVLAGLVVSVVTGTLAGLAPSIKACKLQPVEALRTE